jgi:putative transcriptional regulator
MTFKDTNIVPDSLKEELAKKIVGEIVLSAKPGATLLKWREIFSIKQVSLAKTLKVSPSVISDYEAGRRYPGARFLRRFVEGLFAFDVIRDERTLRKLTSLSPRMDGAIIDVKEFTAPLKAERLRRAVNGIVIAGRKYLNIDIYGYTILDSIRAIESLSGADFYQILGATSERALVFTNVSTGRSPMVAVRVQTLKPKMIILYEATEIDKLAGHLAELEHISLVKSNKPTESDLVDALYALYLKTSGRCESKDIGDSEL